MATAAPTKTDKAKKGFIMPKGCMSDTSIQIQKARVYLVQGNVAKESTRTVASESLLSKASVNENAQEKRREVMGRGKKIKTSRVHWSVIIVGESSPPLEANDNVRRPLPDPSIASYPPGHASHGLLVASRLGIGLLEARKERFTNTLLPWN